MFSTRLEDSAYPDRDLASQVKKLDDIGSAVDLFQEALILTCKNPSKYVGQQRKQPGTNQFHGGQ
jgi:hypothetical protein